MLTPKNPKNINPDQVDSYASIERMRSGGKDRYSMMEMLDFRRELRDQFDGVMSCMTNFANVYMDQNPFASW